VTHDAARPTYPGSPRNPGRFTDAGLYYRGASQLALALQSVLDDPALAGEERARARDRARRLFNWEQVADDYERWFVQMVLSRRPGSASGAS
jgi:glycosyltransferase involved in cell wall biosynthesis